MSKVIAGIYELEEKIGSGGGGTVYLGKHLRLDKKVVLKADKRRLSAGTEMLRREVDMLKGLSHTYIPQVYDFVQEEGIVYTVMDYILGESLDKLLARKQLPSQPQMIKWACQLLEALSYLHKQPPHGILHGDIKPANIMLRPNGDICLIDFNIALALGEDGAVKVGFSRGYASPEHYGADYIADKKAAGGISTNSISFPINKEEYGTEVDDSDKTETDDDVTEVTQYQINSDSRDLNINRQIRPKSGSEKSSVKLDVRSDIYSLGATLYHLISGIRPAQDAKDVVALGTDVCSASVSDILQKAMAVEPQNRYQTADEMLDAFCQLSKKDKRAVRHRRTIIATAAALGVLFLSGGFTAFTGLKQMEQYQKALTLSEYSTDALAKGNVSQAVNLAMQAIPTGKSIFEAPVTAQAKKALADALGVYDLSDGFKSHGVTELPAAPFDIAVSPNGKFFAAVYAYEIAVYSAEDMRCIVTLPVKKSALSDVVFVNNSRILYAGDKGITLYDFNKQKSIWTGKEETNITLSADCKIAAAVNGNEEKAIIYQVDSGNIIKECSFDELHMNVAYNDIFADPQNYIFALNSDGSRLAVSLTNGGLIIYNLQQKDSDIIIYDSSEYKDFKGGFSGKYFAFTAGNDKKSQFAVIDVLNEKYTVGYESSNTMSVKADESGIYLASGNLLVKLDVEKSEEKELAYTNGANITNFDVKNGYCLAATDENMFSFYDVGANLLSDTKCSENCDFVKISDKYAFTGNRNEPLIRVMQLEEHSEAFMCSYEAGYRHDEARISASGETVMLFDYKKFRIYDMSGNIIIQLDIPDSESVYDQQFIRDGDKSWLEVIWYDGKIRRYNAEDGRLILDELREPPSKDLYEEFYTDKYRISSNLHSSPEVYSIDTNRLLATLEEDSYLTYVTQMDKYIITEYISASGKRYGILLDEKLQKIASLPGLCDVYNNTLIFDYGAGSLRQSRLYSIQELIAFGDKYHD